MIYTYTPIYIFLFIDITSLYNLYLHALRPPLVAVLRLLPPLAQLRRALAAQPRLGHQVAHRQRRRADLLILRRKLYTIIYIYHIYIIYKIYIYSIIYIILYTYIYDRCRYKVHIKQIVIYMKTYTTHCLYIIVFLVGIKHEIEENGSKNPLAKGSLNL